MVNYCRIYCAIDCGISCYLWFRAILCNAHGSLLWFHAILWFYPIVLCYGSVLLWLSLCSINTCCCAIPCNAYGSTHFIMPIVAYAMHVGSIQWFYAWFYPFCYPFAILCNCLDGFTVPFLMVLSFSFNACLG